MIKLSIAEFAKIAGGEINGLNSDDVIGLHAVINSKESNKSNFFAAFKGANVDGHDFVKESIANGSPFALVERPVEYPHILVNNVLESLTKLAKFNRAHLPNLKVIGITGSQGKTTTKDFLAHLLNVSGNTVAPIASLNNELGVPLLLLQCDETSKYCIVEMGARHKGDIAHLCEIAHPNIGVVLVVGQAHLGEFGSIESIAQTKQELIDNLPADGLAVLGNYDSYTPKMADGKSLRVITFGENTGCEVRAADVEIKEGRANFDLVTKDGRASVALQLLGAQQIANALAAAAVATELGMGIDAIAAALSTAELKSKWRMEFLEIGGVAIINDSYNANPDSAIAALKSLALITQERGGSSWAILGKMHELGESSTQEHSRVGKIAADIGIDHLISVGQNQYLAGVEGSETMGMAIASQDEFTKFIEHISPGDVLLFKASRAEKLNEMVDSVVSYLRERESAK